MKYYKLINKGRVVGADEKISLLSEERARELGYYPLKHGVLPSEATDSCCTIITYTQESDCIRVNFNMQGDKIQ